MASGVEQNAPLLHLIIEDDEGQRTEIPLTRDEITIGRKDGNTIRLTERNVSRFHARLMRERQAIFIEDLNSSTGVRINGDRITGRVQVQAGDLIEIGDYHLALQGEQAEGLAGSEETMRDGVASIPEATVKMQVEPLDEATVRSPEPGFSSEATTPAAAPPGVQAPLPAPIPESSAPRSEPTAMIRPDQLRPDVKPTSSGEIPEAARAHLVVVSTKLVGQRFELSRSKMVIGRVEDNDLVLDHRSVSRNHAKITFDGRQFSVVDLKSANGVLVNGEEYSQTNLRAGDIVELGHVQLRFVEPGGNFTLSEQEVSRIRSEAVAAEAQRDGDAVGTTARFQRDKVDSELGKRNKLIVIIAAAAVVLLVAAALILIGGDDHKDPGTSDPDIAQPVAPKDPQQPKDPVQPQQPSLSDAQVQEMLAQVQTLVKDGEFDQADAIVGKVLSAQPDNASAQTLVRSIVAERRAKDDFEASSADEKAGRLEDALKKLQSVPEGTLYRQRAVKRADVVRSKLLDEHETKARAAFAEDRFDEAFEEIEAGLLLVPGNRKLIKLKSKVEALRAKVGDLPPAQAKVDKNNTKTDDGKNGRLRKPRKPRKPKKPTVDTAAAKTLYDEGNRLTLQGRIREAIARFKRALKEDPNFADAHRGLGIAYARLEQPEQAVRHYELYLKKRPYAHDAERVRVILRTYYNQQKPK